MNYPFQLLLIINPTNSAKAYFPGLGLNKTIKSDPEWQ